MVFARVRIGPRAADKVLSRIERMPELASINRVSGRNLYYIHFRAPKDSVATLRKRLEKTGASIEVLIVLPDRKRLGSSFERTVVQFRQVAHAIAGEESTEGEQTSLRLADYRLKIIIRELRRLELDWIADRLESSWLTSYLVVQSRKRENRRLAKATDELFRSLSSIQGPFISEALADIGRMFGNLEDMEEREFLPEYTELVLNLRVLVDLRNSYVAAADEEGVRKAYVKSLTAQVR